ERWQVGASGAPAVPILATVPLPRYGGYCYLRRQIRIHLVEVVEMYLVDFACDQARRRARLLPAGGVLLAVLGLLHGIGGTWVALAGLAVQVAGSLLGGGDASVVGGVFWRTLPLALSAAAVTFAVRSGWLHLTHWHSYVAIALIVMAGAIVGNA